MNHNKVISLPGSGTIEAGDVLFVTVDGKAARNLGVKEKAIGVALHDFKDSESNGAVDIHPFSGASIARVNLRGQVLAGDPIGVISGDHILEGIDRLRVQGAEGGAGYPGAADAINSVEYVKQGYTQNGELNTEWWLTPKDASIPYAYVTYTENNGGRWLIVVTTAITTVTAYWSTSGANSNHPAGHTFSGLNGFSGTISLEKYFPPEMRQIGIATEYQKPSDRTEIRLTDVVIQERVGLSEFVSGIAVQEIHAPGQLPDTGQLHISGKSSQTHHRFNFFPGVQGATGQLRISGSTDQVPSSIDPFITQSTESNSTKGQLHISGSTDQVPSSINPAITQSTESNSTKGQLHISGSTDQISVGFSFNIEYTIDDGEGNITSIASSDVSSRDTFTLRLSGSMVHSLVGTSEADLVFKDALYDFWGENIIGETTQLVHGYPREFTGNHGSRTPTSLAGFWKKTDDPIGLFLGKTIGTKRNHVSVDPNDDYAINSGLTPMHPQLSCYLAVRFNSTIGFIPVSLLKYLENPTGTIANLFPRPSFVGGGSLGSDSANWGTNDYDATAVKAALDKTGDGSAIEHYQILDELKDVVEDAGGATLTTYIKDFSPYQFDVDMAAIEATMNVVGGRQSQLDFAVVSEGLDIDGTTVESGATNIVGANTVNDVHLDISGAFKVGVDFH